MEASIEEIHRIHFGGAKKPWTVPANSCKRVGGAVFVKLSGTDRSLVHLLGHVGGLGLGAKDYGSLAPCVGLQRLREMRLQKQKEAIEASPADALFDDAVSRPRKKRREPQYRFSDRGEDPTILELPMGAAVLSAWRPRDDMWVELTKESISAVLNFIIENGIDKEDLLQTRAYVKKQASGFDDDEAVDSNGGDVDEDQPEDAAESDPEEVAGLAGPNTPPPRAALYPNESPMVGTEPGHGAAPAASSDAAAKDDCN